MDQRHINYRGMRALVVLETTVEGWTYHLVIEGQKILASPSFKACSDREQAYAKARDRVLDIINCKVR